MRQQVLLPSESSWSSSSLLELPIMEVGAPTVSVIAARYN